VLNDAASANRIAGERLGPAIPGFRSGQWEAGDSAGIPQPADQRHVARTLIADRLEAPSPMHGEKSVVNQVPDFHVAKGDAPPAFETRIGLACPRDPSSDGL
jgi:hypothetical protein